VSLPATFEVTSPDGRLIRYCRYGPADGAPLLMHSGSPGTRWKRPALAEAIDQCGLHLVVPDRPGYGGSTRQPGRTVADAAADARLLAAAQGWTSFAVAGNSGGGPHALACAALLPGLVTCCAVGGGISPPETTGPLSPDPDNPRRNKTSWLAARGEDAVRPGLEQAGRDIMARVEAGGPEFPPEPGQPPGPPALGDPDAMARLRATFTDSTDGWVDDNIAFAQPWGFALDAITVPVGLWWGSQDRAGRQHADWLLAHLPTATGREYAGGHIPADAAFREMLGWLQSVG
jgi:pimeloyl-ACP methyl ester carboxylesterase